MKDSVFVVGRKKVIARYVSTFKGKSWGRVVGEEDDFDGAFSASVLQLGLLFLFMFRFSGVLVQLGDANSPTRCRLGDLLAA